MRIAVVHPYPWPEVRRGAERYLDDLTRYLTGAGHQVTVVTGTHEGSRRQRRDDGATVVLRRHVPVGPAARLGIGEVESFGMRALVPLLAGRFDVVHALTPSAAIAARVAGRPTLYTVLGHPDRSELPTAAAARWLFTRAVHGATRTAVLSWASAAALRGWAAVDPVVLPPGIRLERFPVEDRPRRGPPRILFSASLADPRKRSDLAVDTLAEVLRRHPDARLLLSGQGAADGVLAGAEARGAAVRDAVDVLGPGRPDEVPARYRQATVTLLPAEHEAFGLALVESLASGTPVVCSPAGGMPEIVTAGVGMVAASTTAAALADAVEEAIALAADPATPARCAQRARMWDWQAAIGPRHQDVYEELVGAWVRRPGTAKAP